jgi:CheY-like chemotaxis protein
VLITTLKRSFANAQIDEADSGLSALERLTHHLYDAVIMDLVMPDLDGAEVVRRLRAQFPEPMRSVPVLGLTANLAADALTACKTAGMNEVMGKPFDRQQLLQILQKWLDDPESTQTSAQGQLPMSARESTS